MRPGQRAGTSEYELLASLRVGRKRLLRLSAGGDAVRERFGPVQLYESACECWPANISYDLNGNMLATATTPIHRTCATS